MILFPNSKINIGLDILRRRDDGFHDIETLMYPVSGLCDILELVPSAAATEFSASGLAVDCPPEKNLCLRAYELMKQRYNIGAVRIHLHKMVPFGAGLGGGSSDAAFVIKGLNSLFELGLDAPEMEAVAAELGSDTAFFIRNVPQMSRGRGEVLAESQVSLAGMKLVIVKPPFGVSTAEAYGGVVPSVPAEPLEERLLSAPQDWRGKIVNDFERHIFAAYPRLADIKRELYAQGAVYAAMSGSGSALYGIFGAEAEVDSAPFGDAFVYQQVMS